VLPKPAGKLSMMSDPIADLLVRIKNSQMVHKSSVSIPHSQAKEAVVKILKDNHYIKTYKVTGKPPHLSLDLDLKYLHNKPVISVLKRISKPGVRIYVSFQDLTKWIRGKGLTILSTSKGVMTASEAKSKKIGGEIICKVS